MNEYIIYTDGSFSNTKKTGKIGAYAFVVLDMHTKEKIIEHSGACSNTDSNRMEMLAVITALEGLTRRSRVLVISDSQYLVTGATVRLRHWIINDWKVKGKKNSQIKNEDLWRRIHSLNSNHELIWKWIKGHNGDCWNEYVDSLATETRLNHDAFLCG